jgi:hypothetical protein
MTPVTYRGRRAFQLENEQLRVTVMAEGGHIAEIFHKATRINPLWTPPWPTMEPSLYKPEQHPEYGGDAESKLLAGIMGHNWCVDLFGVPTKEEAAAGYTVHGEASIVPYEEGLRAELPLSRLRVSRKIVLRGNDVEFEEQVENLLPFDRAIAWQEHVTLGPPFVERGITKVDAPVLRSSKLNGDDFEWKDRVYPTSQASADYHAHLLKAGWMEASNHHLALAIRYEWNLQDFPWLGVWEENCSRKTPPWNGNTMTWGLEFGASPYPESRFRRSTRGLMCGAPVAVWLPALGKRTIRYAASLRALA